VDDNGTFPTSGNNCNGNNSNSPAGKYMFRSVLDLKFTVVKDLPDLTEEDVKLKKGENNNNEDEDEDTLGHQLFSMEMINQKNNLSYILGAKDEEEKQKWVNVLKGLNVKVERVAGYRKCEEEKKKKKFR